MPPEQAQAQTETIRSSVVRSQSKNPAIQRLRNRVLAQADASEVITSYDRMHHRHSRSPG